MSRDFTTKPRPDQPGRCPSIDRDGDEAPCDEPATGWRWYQDVGEHEDLLAVACEFHRNEGGDRMHGLMQQAQTLRADLQHIAEMLGEDPDDVPEGHRLVDHLALRVGYLRGRDAGFDDVEAERDALAGLLAEFVDSEPCSLDHHGYCQSHGHLDEGECHMARARAVLAGSDADASDTQPADQEDQS